MKTTQYAEAIGDYLSSLASLGKSANTIRLYTTVLQRFSEWLSDFQQEIEISPAIIAKYRCELREASLSVNSVRQHLSILHAFFAKIEAFSRLTDGAEKNPVLREEIPEEIAPTYDDALTADEISTLLHTRPEGKGKLSVRNHALIVLLLQSGLRNSELRALTVEDLDFEDKTVTVRHGKGDKGRAAPFPALARQAVAEYLDSGARPHEIPNSAPLFGSTEGGTWHEYNMNALNALVKRYTKKVIGREVHCHLLRHAAASAWDDAGANIRDVQKALGHSDIRTTERVYVQILNRAKAAQNISRVFDGV